MLLDEVVGTYRTLDALTTRAAAMEDPEGFVESTPGLTVIDEVQLAPALLRAIKLVVDRDRRPGRFLLTGSANLLRLREVAESLAGRAAWVELGPLTWAEITGAHPPRVVDAAFGASDSSDFLAQIQLPPASLTAGARVRAIAGGMPATLSLDDEMRGNGTKVTVRA